MTTPIDPNDSHTLTTIYNEVLDCEAQYITDCLNSAEGLISQDELEGMEIDRTRSAVLAVASAVCPEHHAVYDTRTMTVVPIAEVRALLDGMFQYHGDHEDWDFLRYAIPTESEVSR